MSDGLAIPEQDQSVDDAQLISAITAVSETIAAVIGAAPQPLQTRMESWSERHGFGDATEKTKRRILSRQAAFRHLLRVTLYEAYQRRGNLPELSVETYEALQTAAEPTENPAFQECVLDELLRRTDDGELETLVQYREQLFASSQPAEDIGRIYEALIPKEYRQRLGQFRSPSDIGDLLLSWAARPDDRVLDAGLGAGVLSSPFHPRWILNTDPADVIGVDESPFSLLMGATALALYGQAHEPRRGDFLDLSPDELDQDVDAIVCNPPYTSGDTLPPRYKERINAKFEDATGLTISPRSALYSYFLYHARDFLSAGDRAAFITPHNFLGNQYGVTVKQFLCEEYAISALIQFNPEQYRFFPGADTTALISLLEARSQDNAPGETRFIRVDESVDTTTLRQAVRCEQHGHTDWGFINCVPQKQLSPRQNWQSRFDPCNIDTSDLPPLSDFVTIHCGKSTGATEFFCLSQNDVDEYGISNKHLSQLIRRPALVDGYDIREEDWEDLRENGEDVWLFDPDELSNIPDSIHRFKEQIVNDTNSPEDQGSNENTTVRSFLRDGVIEHDLVGTRNIETRPYWYRPPRQDPPRVVVQDAGRDGFPFFLNETTARNIHNFNGFYDVTVDETELKTLLAYLNSNIGQKQVQTVTQTRQGGYEKLRISALRELPVIDPTELDDEIVTDLADTFDELRETARCDGDCESVVARIDEILQQHL